MASDVLCGGRWKFNRCFFSFLSTLALNFEVFRFGDFRSLCLSYLSADLAQLRLNHVINSTKNLAAQLTKEQVFNIIHFTLRLIYSQS